jgi:hypothetical protein
MGAGFFSTLEHNEGWYADPTAYVDHTMTYPVPGASNPWPVLTILLLIFNLMALLAFLRYHGPGKRSAIIVFTGIFFILISTFLYFVPTLGKIFDDTGSYSMVQIISMSRTWIILNYIRLVILVLLFFVGLFALLKFKTYRYRI